MADPLLPGQQPQPEQPPPGLFQSLLAWWLNRGNPQARQAVPEAMNAALPDMMSARPAVMQQRERFRRMDDQTRGD